MNLTTEIRAVLIIVLINVVAIVQSCCNDPFIQRFEISSLKMSNVEMAQLSELSPGASVEFSSFALKLNFEIVLLARATPLPSIFNSAYAFKCDEGIVPQINNHVKEAQLTSTSDFDAAHPSGSSLINLFEYRRVIKECVDNGNEPTDCGEDQYDFTFNKILEDIINNSFAQYGYYNSLNSNFTDLNLAILKHEPSNKDPMQFVLKLIFEDGCVISDTTEFVIFK